MDNVPLYASSNGRGLYNFPGHWIPETGLCMAVEKRPVATTSASSQLLDFSKDSLNSTGLLDKSTVNPVQQQATPTRHVVEEEEEENSCTDTVKLEPLAFTIDFGDVTPGKKKETPKRFAERLASIGGHSKRAPSSKAEVKKVIESQLRHWHHHLWLQRDESEIGIKNEKPRTFLRPPDERETLCTYPLYNIKT